MSKLFLLSHSASKRRKKSSFNRMKSATSERCNTNNFYYSGEGIIPKTVICLSHLAQLQFFRTFGTTYQLKKVVKFLKNQVNTPGIMFAKNQIKSEKSFNRILLKNFRHELEKLENITTKF